MRTAVIVDPEGGEYLLTEYADGRVSLAFREKPWETWNAPLSGEWSAPYDYKTPERRIEDVLSQAGLLWGEVDK